MEIKRYNICWPFQEVNEDKEGIYCHYEDVEKYLKEIFETLNKVKRASDEVKIVRVKLRKLLFDNKLVRKDL